ncbi:MAG TPA: cupin domain-containing protein [Gaiellaceae bacterium]|nr:cupin domain-containing protein [Gaiellaceae bacterium]
MPGYTHTNLMELDNRAQPGGSTTEARFARDAIESEHIGLSHFKYAPGKRSARAHSHKQQEEVYLVLSGSGQVKLDDDTCEVRQWDIVRVAPATVRGFSAGPDGLELLAIGSDRPEGGDGIVVDDESWWGD